MLFALEKRIFGDITLKNEYQIEEFETIIRKLPEEIQEDYYSSKNLTDYVIFASIKIYENDEEYYHYEFYVDDSDRNLCTKCGSDMGEDNPRQLCGKIKCYSEDVD